MMFSEFVIYPNSRIFFFLLQALYYYYFFGVCELSASKRICIEQVYSLLAFLPCFTFGWFLCLPFTRRHYS